MKPLNIITAVIALALVAGACGGSGGSSPSASPVSTRIEAGEQHTCAILEANAIKCWGDNDYGQLGTGIRSDSSTPVSAIGIDGSTSQTSAIQVSAGGGHTCAILETNTVKCWGRNIYGQLGTGARGDNSLTPVSVVGIDGATSQTSAIQVSAGERHTCALLENGAVKCWGRNIHGRLGNGTKEDTYIPVSVIGIDGSTSQTSAIQVSLGDYHTCAILETNAIKCWGSNEYGQLGNGTEESSPIPVSVIGIDGSTSQTSAIQVSAGSSYTCALLETRAVKCWGRNYYGQLGNGDSIENHRDFSADSPTPVSVIGIDGLTPERRAIQVSLGGKHTCAILETNTVKCWGRNIYGRLGNGTRSDNSLTPVSVIGIDGATSQTSAIQVSLGEYHTCALLETRAIKCWGSNHSGRLGNGDSTGDRNDRSADSPIPVDVIGIDASTP